MRGLKSFSITSLLMSWALSVAAQEAPRTRMEVNHEVVRTYAGIYLEQKDFLRAEEVIARYLFLSNE
ncbi:MAG: hypothetical protein EBX52_09255, partial [Proteobacteria bacterium]|nr:hypothetical protein [Pseudomonadota bacterium]